MPASNMGLEIVACHPKSEASTVSFPQSREPYAVPPQGNASLAAIEQWALPRLSRND
jgi:hypothetical protein